MDDFVKERFIKKAHELLVRKAATHGDLRFQEVEGPVTEHIEVFSGIVGSGSAFVLPELHIQDPMKLVFNGPMAAFGFQKLACRHAFAAVDEIMRLL